MRIIAHLDMDAFFASVEERNRPHLKGKPIAVGSDPKEGYGRGVVSTANYKAREYGLRSAMPISHAWRASQKAKEQGQPEVVFLPPSFSAYEKSSAEVFMIIKKYSRLVEQASVDEFYFDLSPVSTLKKAEVICRKIKNDITEKENLTCSVGLGPNKLIAKIAAGIKKPDGLFIVAQKEAESFLAPLPIRQLPGVGPKTETLLHSRDIVIVRDLKKISKENMVALMGKWGGDLYNKARGIDDAPIVEHREVKSIGEQGTFEHDTFDIGLIANALKKYCTQIFDRFLRNDFHYFKAIAITVRFSDFSTISSVKSFAIPFGAGDFKKFQLEALKLLLPFLDKRKNPRLKLIRLIGIRIEKLAKESA